MKWFSELNSLSGGHQRKIKIMLGAIVFSYVILLFFQTVYGYRILNVSFYLAKNVYDGK